jgi:hypothetical protein
MIEIIYFASFLIFYFIVIYISFTLFHNAVEDVPDISGCVNYFILFHYLFLFIAVFDVVWCYHAVGALKDIPEMGGSVH